jgi:hypothetical protein
MTSGRDDRDDDALEREVVRALRERGELIPTTDDEVRAAERELEGDEIELPESLQSYRGRRRAAPDVKRRPWLGYATAGLIGAAAATFLLLVTRPEPPHDLTGAGRDLVRPSASTSASARVPPAPVPVVAQSCSAQCCGGADCKRAPSELAQCPSGQACLECDTNASEGPYRLRLGAMILAPGAERLLEPDRAPPLELCVVAPGAPPACLPALSTGTSDETWRLLGRINSAQDLLSGLRIEVRRQGEPAALAFWTHPVVASPEVRCKGLAVQLRAGSEIVGRLSVFVEQTHFVELARAPTLPELVTRRAEFSFEGIEPRVYETSEPGRRFALVLGPLDRERAQALRWSVLERGKEASVSYGLDFVGTPQPSR